MADSTKPPIALPILPAPFFIGETFFVAQFALKARVLLAPIGPWRRFQGKVPAPREARLERPHTGMQPRQHRRVPGPKGPRRDMPAPAHVRARRLPAPPVSPPPPPPRPPPIPSP